LAGAAALGGAAWRIQAEVLPGPALAAQAAVRANEWLRVHRLSFVVFHARHHRSEGTCLRSWYIQPHSRGRLRLWYGRKDGSLLLLSHGPVVLATGSGRVVLTLGHRLRSLPTFLAVAIGCTHSIGDELIRAAQNGGLSIERGYAANQPAFALELHFHNERLTVYLSPRDYRPLVVIGAEAGHIASARLYLSRLTPAEATRFHHVLDQKGIPLPH
jgi:hypothetical protein